MTIWDDRILEYIRKHDSGSPKKLAESGYVRVSPQHVSRRLKKLAEHDLLADLGNGVYVITDQGEQYLDGEIDADELPNTADEDNKAMRKGLLSAPIQKSHQ